MHELIWYQQARLDGGVRTAVTVDGAAVFHKFESGDEDDSDPTLVWYVDVRCSGKRLPTEAEALRRWFLDQTSLVKGALTALADKLAVGMDLSERPIRFPIPSAPRGVKMRLTCSASYREVGLNIAAILLQVRDRWAETIESLPFVTEETLIW